ncbi:hypothetical protein HAX54_005346 [Datura stramonium]|uniref:Uncharacterized protein n=1 Tax=Datura stramonium TaxID=4076 RepID=A0ABS8T9T3_DATST|nr:hypothetical protein [Datura stramonium]
MKDVFDHMNKLCSRVDVIEGVVSSLKADARELKGRAPLSNLDMSFLDEVMNIPNTARGPIDYLLRDKRKMRQRMKLMVVRLRLMMIGRNSWFRKFLTLLILHLYIGDNM